MRGAAERWRGAWVWAVDTRRVLRSLPSALVCALQPVQPTLQLLLPFRTELNVW